LWVFCKRKDLKSEENVKESNEKKTKALKLGAKGTKNEADGERLVKGRLKWLNANNDVRRCGEKRSGISKRTDGRSVSKMKTVRPRRQIKGQGTRKYSQGSGSHKGTTMNAKGKGQPVQEQRH